jgi:hypothetical protein
MIAFLNPEPAAAVLVSEGHAPVVAVLLASAKEADESIAAPKGRGPRIPAAFSLQNGLFWGPRAGIIIGFSDPSQPLP